ncbi:uncharacterized protein LOC127856104 [Dreissena polymorpha]|uniref:uncharacterized protein LOC127856104 n=1 Tax=Dreissena polymorpha TaxID=45954 RepID=UPI002264993A|nr:uncharacterized protein LOC127856104 [Dreissena polymorpha]XP_052248053.1 uncharacterized protein LOC127856104 [Dreissena polymorpha]
MYQSTSSNVNHQKVVLPPIITWYMDKDTPSDYNDDINITDKSVSNVAGDRTTSTLTITPSQEQHGAIIYCKVSNGYGSIISDRKSRIDVLVPVVIRPIDNATVLQNKALSVTCLYTEGNPPRTSVTWIQVKTSRVVGVEQTLTIPNMQITDEGYYKCRVNNTLEPSGCCAQTPYDETMFYVDVQFLGNGSYPSVWAAVGGAVGGAVMIVVFGLLIYWKKFKRNPPAVAQVR